MGARRREHGEAELLDLYADMGRALGRFSGWRMACLVANAKVRYTFEVTIQP